MVGNRGVWLYSWFPFWPLVDFQSSLSKGLFTWSGGPRSSGVGFFWFHALGDTRQNNPTPLDRGPPLHVNRVLMFCRSPEEIKGMLDHQLKSHWRNCITKWFFLWLKECACFSCLFHLLEKKQQHTTKNLDIGCKSGTCAEYHSSTTVTVSFESLVARTVLISVGIVI